MNDKQRVYLVVNHHGTIQVASLDSDYAFDQAEDLNSGDVRKDYEVKSYKLEGPES